jgi:hypothetical protein
MQQLFSSQDKKFLAPMNNSEKELQHFIWEHRQQIFPEYTFIAQEFTLKGNVRKLGGNGRIDLLAYNPKTRRFVVIELKKEFDDNIAVQAGEYRDYIEDHFPVAYLEAKEKYKGILPESKAMDQSVEVVLIAQGFDSYQIRKAEKQSVGVIRLIAYHWYGNGCMVLDYINAPKVFDHVTNPLIPTSELSVFTPDIVFGSDKKFEATLQASSSVSHVKLLGALRNIIKQAPEKFTSYKRHALWNRIAESVEFKEELQAVPYKKGNISKLREIIKSKWKPNYYKYPMMIYLLKLLKEFG